jgi:guanosine-3',5'-bis(diphosphate) 3'-pyrophosphohydrolase
VLWNEAGVHDPVVIAAALLHDTIEDTETTHDELAAEFGDAIADVVAEVTDDKALPKAARKQLQIDHAPELSRAAKLAKLADKICNLRDIAASPPVEWPLRRRQEYLDRAAAVVDGLRGVHPGLERLFAEAYTNRPR